MALFTEQQRTVLYHDYLIFVCGVEISAWVQSLDITFSDRHGPGSADIVLTNPFDQWTLTLANLKNNVYRRTDDRFSEKAKYAIYTKKRAMSQDLVVNYTQGSTQTKDPNSTTGDFLERYAFGPGSCVFSKFDTVRIFLKNPYDHPDTDRWFPAFTGTVGNRPNPNDYVTAASTVTLQCYDIRAAMTGMRVGVNSQQNIAYKTIAGAKEGKVFIDSDAAGMFKDYYPTPDNLRLSGTDNILSGKKFTDMVSMLITGRIGWVSPDGPIAAGGVACGEGTGFFEPGIVMAYANPSSNSATEAGRVSTLEAWDNLCLFGTKGTFWTQAECMNVGLNSFWQDDYSPMDGKMHFLLPAKGLQISDMVRTSFDGMNNIMDSPDWTDRFSLISKICQQIDYEWSITGNGDVIFEFPMYDFRPTDFGNNSGIYVVDMHVESDNISEEEGEVISGIETQNISSQLVEGQIQAAVTTVANAVMPRNITPIRAVAYSNILASKYGVRIANMTFAGVSTQKALEQLSVIEFQKRLADSNKLSLSFTYRPFVRPNRPLLHQEKNRMGRTTSVRLSLPSYDQKPTISVGLNCVKTPLFNNNQIKYQTIAGGEGMTLSYNAFFEKPDTIGNPDYGGITVNSWTNKDRQQ